MDYKAKDVHTPRARAAMAMEVQTIEAADRPFSPELLQSPELSQRVLDDMSFSLKDGEVFIGTGQPTLRGAFINFGAPEVLYAQIEAAHLLKKGIENLAQKFEAAQNALE